MRRVRICRLLAMALVALPAPGLIGSGARAAYSVVYPLGAVRPVREATLTVASLE